MGSPANQRSSVGSSRQLMRVIISVVDYAVGQAVDLRDA